MKYFFLSNFQCGKIPRFKKLKFPVESNNFIFVKLLKKLPCVHRKAMGSIILIKVESFVAFVFALSLFEDSIAFIWALENEVKKLLC